MVFSSTVFLFLFLPIVLAVNAVLPRESRNLWLLVASLAFYAWGEGLFVLVMIGSIAMNYVYGLLIARNEDRSKAKTILALAVVTNLGLLGYYKYANFLAANLSPLFRSLGLSPIELAPIHLPIGISFFTFHALSYVIDVYRKTAPAQRSPGGMGLYIALFPQLVAGPIIRYGDVAHQLGERSVDLSRFALGTRRFIAGLAKKILLANTFAAVADPIFGLPNSELTPAVAWLGVVCYTLQIYFDFSGYSDMAIGLGHMFGFHFRENFDHPYVARSIRDFWRRWHISLSSWFRDYLYIPLGGGRRSPLRVYFNLVLVFFLCGLWHGPSWTFVAWGLFHGLFLALERLGLERLIARLPWALRHVYVMAAVMIGWTLFRANDFTQALAFLAAMMGSAHGDGTASKIPEHFDWTLAVALVAGIVGSAPVLQGIRDSREWVFARMGPDAAGRMSEVYALAGSLVYAVVFFWCGILISTGAYNPFIYFRF